MEVLLQAQGTRLSPPGMAGRVRPSMAACRASEDVKFHLVDLMA
jgi:hypothetical protein